MPPLNIEIQTALSEMERAMAIGGAVQTFTWKLKEVPCIPSSRGRTVVIDAQGNPVNVDLTLIVRRDEFLTADSTLVTIDSDLYTADDDTPTPVSGWLIPFEGRRYKIVTAKESGPKSHFELTLKDEGSA